MQFTTIPQDFSSLFGNVIYSIECDVPTSFDAEIIDTQGGLVIGVKHFDNVTRCDINIAPYLRRKIKFTPTVGATGFVKSDAIVSAAVKIGNLQSPARRFVATNTMLTSATILTTMPSKRCITHGQSDVITIFSPASYTVAVTAYSEHLTECESYNSTGDEVVAFRLNTHDFPDAERIVVSIGNFGELEYAVVPHGQSAQRMAWRSTAGSIESYSFPIEKERKIEVSKKMMEGADGRHDLAIECEELITLLSAYEIAQTIDALSEIVSSPQVWMVDNDGYHPTYIPQRSILITRHGELSFTEIDVLRKIKRS